MLSKHNIDNYVYELINGEDKLLKMLSPRTLAILHNPYPPNMLIRLAQIITCPKVFLYHNTTPSFFFEGHEPEIKTLQDVQLSEISKVSPYFRYAWGVSEYNCSQLEQVGFLKTAAANPPFDFNRYEDIAPSNEIEKDDNKTSIIFVGRVTYNKRLEDIIKAFYYYYKINPNSILTLIGPLVHDNYNKILLNLVSELNIPVQFTGMIPTGELVAYYKNADLFLCMSEHEGFCIPIIEAMHFGIPVIAFSSTAVLETVTNAGILFSQKHFPSVAHLMNEVMSNNSLREKMISAGKERAQYYNEENSSKRFMKLINDYANELGFIEVMMKHE